MIQFTNFGWLDVVYAMIIVFVVYIVLSWHSRVIVLMRAALIASVAILLYFIAVPFVGVGFSIGWVAKKFNQWAKDISGI